MNHCTDTNSVMVDVYDDGIDVMSMSVDLDGDGWSETIVSDTNRDGVADVYDWLDPNTGTQVIGFDADTDGLIDAIVTDSDGDGEFDDAAIDTDGDGVLDTTFDPGTGETFDPTSPTVDPGVEPTEGDVHGDPMAEIPYHQAQVSDNDCLPTSVAMVATEALGVDVPQADLVALADELELLGPDGMSLDGGVTLLEQYGLDAEVQAGSLDDLRTLLDAGTPVIIGLDADDLYGQGDQPFADDFAMGHAVVITGIDDEAGLVYINDPGFPDGAGVAVSIDEFEDAWIDGGNSMIVVDAPDAAGAETMTGSGTEALSGGDESGLGLVDLVLLPLRLVAR